jgi:hypothetical protein
MPRVMYMLAALTVKFMRLFAASCGGAAASSVLLRREWGWIWVVLKGRCWLRAVLPRCQTC